MKRTGLISFMALLLSVATLFGQPSQKTVESVLYYRYNSSALDESYLTNRINMASLDEILSKYAASLDSIVITAYSSPEGKEHYNRKLSERRASAMTEYLSTRYPGIDTLLHVTAGGEDYYGTVRMIEEDPNVPYKADVLKILRKADGHNNDRLFWLVACMNNGVSYRYIKQNILPYLRTATSVVCYFSTPVALAETVKRPATVTTRIAQVPAREMAVSEIENYTYIIKAEDMYRIDSLSGNRIRRDDVCRYVLTINSKEKETVGEYSLVAPNGTTNLSGWYSLASAPSLTGHAQSGSFTDAGEPMATYIASDSCWVAVKEGAIRITHYEEDNRIDVEGEGLTVLYADGRTATCDLEQLDCAGNGMPPVLTYVVTASPVERLEGVSRYTVEVTHNFSGIVGEYSLVAPNGMTNLSGWYSLTSTPETQGQAIAGSFDGDGQTTGTYAVVDGERIVLRSGSIGITQHADNTMDIVCESAAGQDAEGNPSNDHIEMRDVRGEGIPMTDGRRETYATEEISTPRLHGFALKTNLLYDAATAVNVALEVPIGKRLSVETSWLFPWWLPKNWSWCGQMLWGEVEGRVWLGNRAERGFLQGHFIGAYVGSGLYDLQFSDDRGWQGEFVEAGLGYGFVKGLKCGLNLEFELGFGFMQTDYRGYIHTQKADGSEVLYLYRQNEPGKPLQYFGPTKAKVALVWPITWNSRSANKKRVQNER